MYDGFPLGGDGYGHFQSDLSWADVDSLGDWDSGLEIRILDVCRDVEFESQPDCRVVRGEFWFDGCSDGLW